MLYLYTNLFELMQSGALMGKKKNLWQLPERHYTRSHSGSPLN